MQTSLQHADNARETPRNTEVRALALPTHTRARPPPFCPSSALHYPLPFFPSQERSAVTPRDATALRARGGGPVATVTPPHRVRKAGWLTKQPLKGHLLSRARQRYVVLTDGAIHWYEDERQLTLKGSLPLAGARVERDGSQLRVHAGGQCLVLSGDDLDAWEAIVRGVTSPSAPAGEVAPSEQTAPAVASTVPSATAPLAAAPALPPPAGAPTRKPSSAPTAATDASASEERTSAERRLRVIGQAMRVQSAGSGDYAGAEFLFGPDGLPPSYWGVSKAQLTEFREAVAKAVADGTLINPHAHDPHHLHHYPQQRFDDPAVGPNMYQVTDQFLKPLTKQHPELPGVSYALMRNAAHGGLRCDLFFSHVWSEGVYEFIAHALAHWPDECEGAYICTLSNPQNLNIGTLLGSQPRDSPFYKVLTSEPRPRMLMLANRHTPIHTRLWCVYEAFLAYELGIAVSIAGEALHLLSGDLAEFLRLKEDAAKRMVDEARAPVTEAVASLEAQGAAALHTLLPRVDAAFEEVGRAKLRVLRAEDATLVDFERATCFSEADADAIRSDIGTRSRAAASFVAGLVRDAVCRGSEEAGEAIALDGADLTVPTSIFALVARMWLGRATVTRLALRRCMLSAEGMLDVQHAARWLTQLQVRSDRRPACPHARVHIDMLASSARPCASPLPLHVGDRIFSAPPSPSTLAIPLAGGRPQLHRPDAGQPPRFCAPRL